MKLIYFVFLLPVRDVSFQSLVIPEKFQHILRIMNTNIDGNRKVPIAMTAIKGVGRRYANIVLKKADVDLTKRAGECTDEEVSLFDFVFYLLTSKDSDNHVESYNMSKCDIVACLSCAFFILCF